MQAELHGTGTPICRLPRVFRQQVERAAVIQKLVLNKLPVLALDVQKGTQFDSA